MNLFEPLDIYLQKKDIKDQFIFQYCLHTLHYKSTFLERPHLHTLAEELTIFFYPVHPLYPQYGCCPHKSRTIKFSTMGLRLVDACEGL